MDIICDDIPLFSIDPKFRPSGRNESLHIDNRRKRKNTLPLLGFLSEGKFGSVMGPVPTLKGCDGFVKVYPLMVHSIKGKTKIQPNNEIKTFRQLAIFKENYAKGIEELKKSDLTGWRFEIRLGASTIALAMGYIDDLGVQDPEMALKLVGCETIKVVPVRVFFTQLDLVQDHMEKNWRQRNEDRIPQGMKKAILEAMNFMGFGSPYWFFLKNGISASRWLADEDYMQERLHTTEEDAATDAMLLEDVPVDETSALERDILEQLEWRQNPNRRFKRVHVVHFDTGRLGPGFETTLLGAKFIAEHHAEDWMELYRRKEEFMLGPDVIQTTIQQEL